MIDLTPIFQAVIALLAALITYKLIPWIKSRTTAQQQENLEAAARIAVYAAEQIFGSLAEQNRAKLDYALERLRAAGFALDEETLRSAVEQAVYDLKTAESVRERLQPVQYIDGTDDEDWDDLDALDTEEDELPDEADAEEFAARSPWPDAAEHWHDPAPSAAEEDAPGVTEPPPDGEA